MNDDRKNMTSDISGEICFRCAVEADLDEICRLAEIVRKTPGCAWDEEYPARENFAESLEFEGLYIAEAGGRIIATCGIEPATDVFAELDCWSKAHKKPCVGCRLGVSPDYQGQHLAQRLIRFCLEDCVKRHAYDGLHFFVDQFNERAIAVYERMGFRRVGTARWLEEDWFCYESDLPFLSD